MVWALRSAFASAVYFDEFDDGAFNLDYWQFNVTGSLEDDMDESTVDTADGISEVGSHNSRNDLAVWYRSGA